MNKKTTAASRVSTTSKAVKKSKSGAVKKVSKVSATKTPTNVKSTSSAETMLKVGQKAPTFALSDDKGKVVKLSDFKGKTVVLFFYPKDDTPGCTTEACSFRDGLVSMKRRGAVVLGVSPDSVESHKKFVNKFDLNFPLLSDVEKKMLLAYGVWKEKSMYGRKYMGVERTTFVIDGNGKIAVIFPKVKVGQHYDEVLTALADMD